MHSGANRGQIRSANPTVLSHFASDHVCHLDNAALDSMIRAWLHVLVGLSPGPGERPAQGEANSSHERHILSPQIDEKFLMRYQHIGVFKSAS